MAARNLDSTVKSLQAKYLPEMDGPRTSVDSGVIGLSTVPSVKRPAKRREERFRALDLTPPPAD
jgi:hypothetical protein